MGREKVVIGSKLLELVVMDFWRPQGPKMALRSPPANPQISIF
jgi:hypothetical protein